MFVGSGMARVHAPSSSNGRVRMEQAVNQMRELQKLGDAEIAHSLADDLLCEMLETLGCHDLVAEWRKINKWYA